MECRAAEGEGARATTLAVLIERVLGSGTSRYGSCQCLCVEARTSPRDVGIVHLVRDAVVMKGREEPGVDAFGQVTTEHQILPTEAEEVASIGALRCSGQPEEELGLEVIDNPTISAGCGVVELVHDHVVKLV